MNNKIENFTIDNKNQYQRNGFLKMCSGVRVPKLDSSTLDSARCNIIFYWF